MMDTVTFVRRKYLEREGEVCRPVAVVEPLADSGLSLCSVADWFGQVAGLASMGVVVRQDEVVCGVQEDKSIWYTLLVPGFAGVAKRTFGEAPRLVDVARVPVGWFRKGLLAQCVLELGDGYWQYGFTGGPDRVMLRDALSHARATVACVSPSDYPEQLSWVLQRGEVVSGSLVSGLSQAQEASSGEVPSVSAEPAAQSAGLGHVGGACYAVLMRDGLARGCTWLGFDALMRMPFDQLVPLSQLDGVVFVPVGRDKWHVERATPSGSTSQGALRLQFSAVSVLRYLAGLVADPVHGTVAWALVDICSDNVSRVSLNYTLRGGGLGFLAGTVSEVFCEVQRNGHVCYGPMALTLCGSVGGAPELSEWLTHVCGTDVAVPPEDVMYVAPVVAGSEAAAVRVVYESLGATALTAVLAMQCAARSDVTLDFYEELRASFLCDSVLACIFRSLVASGAIAVSGSSVTNQEGACALRVLAAFVMNSAGTAALERFALSVGILTPFD